MEQHNNRPNNPHAMLIETNKYLAFSLDQLNYFIACMCFWASSKKPFPFFWSLHTFYVRCSLVLIPSSTFSMVSESFLVFFFLTSLLLYLSFSHFVGSLFRIMFCYVTINICRQVWFFISSFSSHYSYCYGCCCLFFRAYWCIYIFNDFPPDFF